MPHRDGEEEQSLLEAIRDGRAWKLLAENIPLLPINRVSYFRQKCHPNRVHSYTKWQKGPVVTTGGLPICDMAFCDTSRSRVSPVH